MENLRKVIEVLSSKNQSQRLLIEGFDKPIWVKHKNNGSCKALSVGDNCIVQLKTPVELDDFWNDVDSRVGMDVCTPFIKRFKGHSFVAFQNGIVWSKTMNRAFLLKNGNPRLTEYPKSMIGRPYSFGSDLSDL